MSKRADFELLCDIKEAGRRISTYTDKLSNVRSTTYDIIHEDSQ